MRAEMIRIVQNCVGIYERNVAFHFVSPGPPRFALTGLVLLSQKKRPRMCGALGITSDWQKGRELHSHCNVLETRRLLLSYPNVLLNFAGESYSLCFVRFGITSFFGNIAS